MSAQTDFHLQIERAAGLALDATCACRAARTLPLPAPHRRLLADAIRGLEAAQQSLFIARRDPWSGPPKPRHRQLDML